MIVQSLRRQLRRNPTQLGERRNLFLFEGREKNSRFQRESFHV